MVVFVHGVPETHHLWRGIREALGRKDTIAVACPGFGNPRPTRFAATKEAYVDWLVAELEKIGEPVDLVGHDWGGAFTVRVASIRPDLLSSWVSDAAGICDVNFEWHEFAKVWQAPGAGEEFWRRQLAMPLEDRAQTFVDFGVPLEKARDLAGRIDRTMGEVILALYRSAVNVGLEWAPAVAQIKTPGLVVLSELDPFVNADRWEESARKSGAKVARLEGLGHWWPLQDPSRGRENAPRVLVLARTCVTTAPAAASATPSARCGVTETCSARSPHLLRGSRRWRPNPARPARR